MERGFIHSNDNSGEDWGKIGILDSSFAHFRNRNELTYTKAISDVLHESHDYFGIDGIQLLVEFPGRTFPWLDYHAFGIQRPSSRHSEEELPCRGWRLFSDPRQESCSPLETSLCQFPSYLHFRDFLLHAIPPTLDSQGLERGVRDMNILSIPEAASSRHVQTLNLALQARGHSIVDSPTPFIRWPINLARFLKRGRGKDAWLLHWQPFDSLTIARLAMRYHAKKIWTVHNLHPHHKIGPNDQLITRLLLDGCNAVVWHSRRTFDEAVRTFEGFTTHSIIIPALTYNGFFPDDPTVSIEAARDKLGIDVNELVLGHFAPGSYKGTDIFLKLCRVLGCRPLIFGQTRIPDEQLQYYFKSCDLMVHPYTDITTASCQQFASAFKRPTLATDLGNLPDTIEHRVTGWTFPLEVWEGDIERIADAVSHTSRDMLRSMGEAAYRLSAVRGNIDDVARLYEKVIYAT